MDSAALCSTPYEGDLATVIRGIAQEHRDQSDGAQPGEDIQGRRLVLDPAQAGDEVSLGFGKAGADTVTGGESGPRVRPGLPKPLADRDRGGR